MYSIKVIKSPNSAKKLRAYIHHDGKIEAVDFGANGYKDYTIYYAEDPEKAEVERMNYIARHSKNEDWTIKGINTAGFWSRWILWEKPTITEAIKNVIKKFKLKRI